MLPPGGFFTCSGCRQQIRVCHPAAGSVIITCPIDNCRREVWALPRPDDAGLMIGAYAAPDRSRRFSIDQERLLIDGAELLMGPADLLRVWAEHLNHAALPDHEIPDRIRLLIQRYGRGCTFQPGAELVRLGLAAQEPR